MNIKGLLIIALGAIAMAPTIADARETITRTYNGVLYVYTCPNSCVVGANGSVSDSGGEAIQIQIYPRYTQDK